MHTFLLLRRLLQFVLLSMLLGMQALQEASPQTDAIILSPRTMADALQDVIRVYPLPCLGFCGTAVVCSWLPVVGYTPGAFGGGGRGGFLEQGISTIRFSCGVRVYCPWM